MKYLSRWGIFVKERFNPGAYFVMILVFFAAHLFTYESKINLNSLLHFLPLLIAIFLLFFQLRLFDEIKDCESDKKNFPDRPLPRGLLKKKDLLNVICVIIVIELSLFSYYGMITLLTGIATILYSLLMYKEFFLSNWLRAHLTTYAITHTIIATLVSITIFTAFTNKAIFQMSSDFIYFALGSWFLFNIFEFGRKTFASNEEKPNTDSYSKIFGRYGAVFLIILMAILGTKSTSVLMESEHIRAIYFWDVVLSVLGILYAVSDKNSYAKIYRILSTIYIILIYGTIVVSNLLTKL